MIKLDILSDPICPWCHIGKAQLDRALEARPDHPFEIEWHPFQLNPEMPSDGMDRRAYLEEKFGGKHRAASVYGRIAKAAADAGLPIAFERIARTPNTLNAHRVIHWAGLEGRQTPMVSVLFRGYFLEGLDIGDPTVLADLAGSVGLDRAMITQLLDGDSDRDEISARDAHARSRGVTGVPTFVVANQHVLQGAQPTEIWLRAIDDVMERLKGSETGT